MKLSGVREDSKLLKLLMKAGCLSEEVVCKCVLPPLLVVPDAEPFGFRGDAQFTFRDVDRASLAEAMDELPSSFGAIREQSNDIVYALTAPPHDVPGMFTDAANVSSLPAPPEEYLTCSLVFAYNKSMHSGLGGWAVLHKDDPKKDGVKVFYAIAQDKRGRLDTAENAEGLYSDMLMAWCRDLLHSVCLFVEEARYGDKYPVVMRNRNAKLPKRKYMYKYTGAPRLVYLNKMPSVSNGEGTKHGTHAPHRGHQRRGHWRHLNHERYKDHPKYQDPKGIYIRPMWVGPTDVEYEGNRYTLVVRTDKEEAA